MFFGITPGNITPDTSIGSYPNSWGFKANGFKGVNGKWVEWGPKLKEKDLVTLQCDRKLGTLTMLINGEIVKETAFTDKAICKGQLFFGCTSYCEHDEIQIVS